MAVTCAYLGRQCFPVPSLEAAVPLAARLHNPLLAGELGGCMPYGFDMNNSPVELEIRSDIHRPMILLSTSGTRVMCGAKPWQAVYIACLRNYRVQIAHLVEHHSTVAVIGAGSRAEFREEDQLCCAWIAGGLVRAGFEPENDKTATIIEQWSDAPLELIARGASADYLRNSGQSKDLDYILMHVDDVHEVYLYEHGQVVKQMAVAIH